MLKFNEQKQIESVNGALALRNQINELIDGICKEGYKNICWLGIGGTYAAAMTITFMNAWNSYMWPKVIMTQSKSMTMPMVVANLTEGYVTDYGMLMLAVLICTLPTALVFFILQKSFAEGITGAVK
jgi:hypothetical protein